MGDSVLKRTFFAADSIHGVNQYQYEKPSDILARIINIDRGNLDFSSDDMKKVCRLLPDKMTGFCANSKGAIDFGTYKVNKADGTIKADYDIGTGVAGSTIAGSGIVSILAMDTIMEGAMPFLAARKSCTVYNMRTEMETMPFFTPRTSMKARAPLSDVQDIAQNMGKAVMQAKPYGLTCSVGKEILADASGDIMASILREMGATMEITLDTLVISTMLDNASSTTSTVAQTDALKGFNKARGLVGKNGFRPTSALVSPMFLTDMISNYIPSYNETAQKFLDSGELPKFVGLDIGESGITSTATSTWDWGTSAYVGGMVFDKTRSGAIGIREDMKVEEFDNVTKVLINPVLTSRFTYTPAKDADKTGRTNKDATVLIVQSS